MPRKKRGRKRMANRGSFQAGPDTRRHQFSRQDCRMGYWVAAIKHPELREWLQLKIRIHYQRKERDNGQGQKDRRGGENPADDNDLPF